jgi:hypothetical protein
MKKIRFLAPLLFLAGLSGVLFGGSSPAVAQGNDNDFEKCLRICRQINRDCQRNAENPGQSAQCRQTFRICSSDCAEEN